MRTAGEDSAADPRSAPVEAFLDDLVQQRRLSAATRTSYAHALAELLALTRAVALEAIEPHHIRRAAAQLHARGLQGSSIALNLSAWRGFFRWMVRQRGLPANPCVGIRAPKSPRRLPKALSPDDAQRLLDARAEGWPEARDAAMFELLYSSGLRLAELISLELVDADTMRRQQEVTVTGKGSKTRTVPVGSKALEALDRWLVERKAHAHADETALFIGARGARIAQSAVRDRLRRWALKRGLPLRVHPHVLRHSFASHMLQSSSDLRAVQELLGHASISTTQIYTHLDFQHLAKAYDAAHPRARKKA